MKANELLKQINPVEFYKEYGHDLTRKGNYRCNLPGHDDTNPSLSIDSKSGLFNCFACGQKGNMVNWYMLYHNVDYKEAIKQLAEKYNIELFKSNKKQNSEKEKLTVDLVEKCHQELPEDIRTYLNNRGIPDTLIDKYKLGWGEFYSKYWVTIPIKDKNGKHTLLKLRRNPMEENKNDE